MTELVAEKTFLRPEIGDDRDFLIQLYISTRETDFIHIGWTAAEIHPFLEQQYEAQYHAYRQLYPAANYQLIEYQGVPVGRLYLNRGEDEYRIIDLALLPEFRNRHLGRNLIQSIQHSAAVTEKPVTLHVEHNNPAIRLYRRLGFEVVEERGIHLLMRWRPDCVN